jgi:3,4-dihydroxy 2-butanone 4-phosphate synthase/GTP cyclohydrolase II
VRMHALSMFTDIFGEASDRAGLLAGAMEMIAEEGTGVIVVLNRAMTDGRLGRVMAARAAGQPPETIPKSWNCAIMASARRS